MGFWRWDSKTSSVDIFACNLCRQGHSGRGFSGHALWPIGGGLRLYLPLRRRSTLPLQVPSCHLLPLCRGNHPGQTPEERRVSVGRPFVSLRPWDINPHSFNSSGLPPVIDHMQWCEKCKSRQTLASEINLDAHAQLVMIRPLDLLNSYHAVCTSHFQWRSHTINVYFMWLRIGPNSTNLLKSVAPNIYKMRTWNLLKCNLLMSIHRLYPRFQHLLEAWVVIMFNPDTIRLNRDKLSALSHPSPWNLFQKVISTTHTEQVFARTLSGIDRFRNVPCPLSQSQSPTLTLLNPERSAGMAFEWT